MLTWFETLHYKLEPYRLRNYDSKILNKWKSSSEKVFRDNGSTHHFKKYSKLQKKNYLIVFKISVSLLIVNPVIYNYTIQLKYIQYIILKYHMNILCLTALLYITVIVLNFSVVWLHNCVHITIVKQIDFNQISSTTTVAFSVQRS